MKLVIIEGCQGSGKSTLSNRLREEVKYSTLIKLCGLPPIEDQKYEIAQYHREFLTMISLMSHLPITFILDRSFLSEHVYAKLYKDYEFSNETTEFLLYLQEMELEVLFVLLTADKETLTERLHRPGKEQYQNIEYKADESIKQQNEYTKVFKRIPFDTLVLDESYQIEDKIRVIKEWLNNDKKGSGIYNDCGEA